MFEFVTLLPAGVFKTRRVITNCKISMTFKLESESEKKTKVINVRDSFRMSVSGR